MRNELQTLIIIAALGIVFSFGATTGFGQNKEQITGGYSEAEVTAPQVVSAANFAVKTQAKKDKSKIRLVKISRAEQQVVAGMNYNVCLQIQVREKGKKTFVPQTVQAVVFLNLKQKFELTSWAVAACVEEKLPEMPVK